MKRIAFSLLLLFLINCTKHEALLSFLTNQRMVVILKGTYATDSPLNFEELNNNVLYTDADDPLDLTGVPAYNALPLFFDIGEVRLSSKSPGSALVDIKTNADAVKFWDVVSTERQVYCSVPYALRFDNDTCYQTGGLVNFVEFMNGRGAVYPSRDVGAAIYVHSGLFIRAYATGFSRAAGALIATEKFDNNTIIGSNVLTNLNYDAGIDPTVKATLPPQWFPIHYAELGPMTPTMNLNSAYTTAVLELRMNIKENLMVHSYTNGSSQQQTIVGISDWRVNHVGQFDMGGNVLARSRIYYPALTVDLNILGGTQSYRHYYALYAGGEKDFVNFLPMAATPVRNGVNTIRYLNAGEYTLLCMKDTIADGYPEEVVRSTTVTIGTGPGVAQTSLACP